jgi:hypothetical protein
MNRLLVAVTCLAAFAVAPVAAQQQHPARPFTAAASAAGWGGARWGASPEEVQRAIPAARPVPLERQGRGCGEGDGRALLEITQHRDFGRTWETTFCFSGVGASGLRAVHMWRADDTNFHAVAREMITRHGEPSHCTRGQLVPGERYEWAAGGTSITFVHMQTHSGGIAYKAAQPPR